MTYLYFNSRPHEEVDKRKLVFDINQILFQLTTSRRGRRNISNVLIWNIIFQLTTSRRGRRNISNIFVWNIIFQLTTSRRGRRLPFYQRIIVTPYFNSRPHEEVDSLCHPTIIYTSSFQLTTSRRGRQLFQKLLLHCLCYFNSRPHEEVDEFFFYCIM